MTTFLQAFTIHPVGQGLFYTGRVEQRYNHQSPFRFVYDCGSLNAANIKEEVAGFRGREDILHDRLNLLVISHFHQDHISHIRHLLAGGVKIDKLVMPFIQFTERLYLCMVAIEQRGEGPGNPPGGGAGGVGGNDPDDLSDDDFNFLLRLMIDPLLALAENLDGDSEVVFIQSSGDSPGPGGGDFIEPDRRERETEGLLGFDFPAESKEALATDVTGNFRIPPGLFKVSQVKDRFPGMLGNVATRTTIMEFIFFRRSIGPDEGKFYEAVYQECLNEFGIEKDTDLSKQREMLLGQLLQLRGGTRIIDVFTKARKKVQIKLQGVSVTDMNTTALCLLHRNTRAMYEVAGIDFAKDRYYYWDQVRVCQINKPKGLGVDFCKEQQFDCYPHNILLDDRFPYRDEPFSVANILLTSDGYLQTVPDVDGLHRHYQHYWDLCSLFQLPHHGSKENSGDPLISRIPGGSNLFVNYGTVYRNSVKWSHPSDEVIKSVCKAYRSKRLYLVNEFQGLLIQVEISSWI
jgi:hypothetical protein